MVSSWPPQLCAREFSPPYGDRDPSGNHSGNYTFIKYCQNGKLGLVREKEDGTMCTVFLEVRFISVSEEVLMVNGILWACYSAKDGRERNLSQGIENFVRNR